ncbi:hypothetical protein B0T18DRAFT_484283 [Schizothecium vesticola]|uniref:Uncharacterized protein n=1 Tax=Schizothecium vesticola TaxID=314040 RepID=A0AA40F9B2_9PEZI|nr:hypothetical protein B0T18DRAFT_484283 [Schizothecium vesticola]
MSLSTQAANAFQRQLPRHPSLALLLEMLICGCYTPSAHCGNALLLQFVFAQAASLRAYAGICWTSTHSRRSLSPPQLCKLEAESPVEYGSEVPSAAVVEPFFPTAEASRNSAAGVPDVVNARRRRRSRNDFEAFSTTTSTMQFWG